MASSVYRELAQHLDRLPGGFPSTPDGVELRILRRLFSAAEAHLACRLTLIPETPRVVGYRAGVDAAKAAAMLDAMWRKGLILKQDARHGAPRYLASQFVVGIWEFQVNRLTPELVADMDAYLPLLFDADTWRRAPQMRTIPVGRSIDPRLCVLPHEAADELLRRKRHWVISPCICRKERRMTGQGCDGPLEACISFGDSASYLVETGIGRPVDRAAVTALLKRADRAGLVLQPSNSRDPAWICCCCPCCCGVLRMVRQQERPADLLASPFSARIDRRSCNACGRCVRRCPMDALASDDAGMQLNAGRCIGCGLCVSTCPTGALRLIRKPRTLQPRVPGSITGALLRTAWQRRTIGPLRAAAEFGRSQRDRWRSGRAMAKGPSARRGDP